MNTYACDIEKLKAFYRQIGLPVVAVNPGHTTYMIVTDRELTEEEKVLLSRVMVGPFGAYVVPEPTVVTDLVGE